MLAPRLATLFLLVLGSAPPEASPEVQRPTVQRPQASDSRPAAAPPEAVPAPATPVASATPGGAGAGSPPAATESSPVAPAPAPAESIPSSAAPELAPSMEAPDAPAIYGELDGSSAPLQGRGDAILEVFVYSEVDFGPLPDVRISVVCTTCADAPPAVASTEPGGVAVLRDLPPGKYLLMAYAPSVSVEGEAELRTGDRYGIRIGIPRAPYQPSDDKGRPAKDFSGSQSKRQADVLLGVGGVLAVAGLGMTAGAVIEAYEPSCEIGEGGCGEAPRSNVVSALAGTAALTLAASVISLGFGAHKRRTWRYGASAGKAGAMLSVGGRF